MSASKTEQDRYLTPRLLQVCGILLLFASAVFWGFTGRESALLMASAMTLIGAGSYSGVVVSLKRRTETEEGE